MASLIGSRTRRTSGSSGSPTLTCRGRSRRPALTALELDEAWRRDAYKRDDGAIEAAFQARQFDGTCVQVTA
jgi:hypothetical protein